MSATPGLSARLLSVVATISMSTTHARQPRCSFTYNACYNTAIAAGVLMVCAGAFGFHESWRHDRDKPALNTFNIMLMIIGTVLAIAFVAVKNLVENDESNMLPRDEVMVRCC